MNPQDVNIGFLSSSAVRTLREAIELAKRNQDRIDQWSGQNEIDVPAKLTAYDSATGAYSWVEQWFDSDGNRVDYEGGRSGGPDYMPAYAIGNGIAPDSWEFPIEVRLFPRINTSQGVVYEFPWNCSCNDGGSNSGSASGSASGSTYLVSCNDEQVPSVLYATFGGDFAYLGTLEITYNTDPLYLGWASGLFNIPCDGSGDQLHYFVMRCIGDGTFSLSLCYYIGFPCDGATGTPDSYSPFYVAGSDPTMFLPGCFISRNFSVVVTEDMP